jgi:hypothetical protein
MTPAVSRFVVCCSAAALSIAGGLSACGDSNTERLIGRDKDAAVGSDAATDARSGQDAGVSRSPRLEVRPPSRCMEAVGLCEDLEIANVGSDRLRVSRIELVDAFDGLESRDFEFGPMLPPCRGLTSCRLAMALEPAESIKVDVCLNPTNGSPPFAATLRVVSDDPNPDGPRRRAALADCGF